jgi:hypothetical protein
MGLVSASHSSSTPGASQSLPQPILSNLEMSVVRIKIGRGGAESGEEERGYWERVSGVEEVV